MRYALVMCGAPVPSGYDQVFTIPARSIVALSTTYLTHLENLGVVDKIKGIGLAHYVYSQRIHNQIAAGKTIALGQGSTLNQEALFLLKPDVVFTYGTGNPNTDVLPVLRKGNLPVAIVAEYREPSPLARTEWIKFLALFFNAEEKADRYFHQVEKRYQQLKQLTQNVKKRPTVMAGFSYQGVWYVPGGKTYPAQLLADAGANYLWANDASKESLQLSFEDVLLKGQQAEYWVNGDQTWRTVKDILKTDDRYSQFRAVQNRNVYLANKRLHEKGANDFWESGVANPHLILADLIKIFHPQLLPDHELVYYQKIQP
ncbi:MAG: ABC transporter substrate-binding protein [Pseudanabaenaceae cyanobacterium SKYGB_i_bin29]|nr:ABC transporter substrate-binding protein [Pseudanabaenaceae cyanobacterium SKYG29]MDW8421363.1 ABC transporter substrate-binding protein [Pseudanabaenaceae cyanobacterium SKYGB_i_bin29]